MRFYLLILLTILIFPQVSALNASELAEQLNAGLESGSVLMIMKWDGKKFLTYDAVNDTGDFEIEPGKAYYVLTDLKGIEFVDMPFSIQPNISSGWNLVLWSEELRDYNLKQITCFDPENQKYFTIIPGFNDEFIPAGLGCWILVNEKRVENETPCAIYGEIKLDGKKAKAVVTAINDANQRFEMIEADGKFVIELLNIDWLPGDNVTLHVQSGKLSKIISLKPKTTPYRIDIELQSQGGFFWYFIPLVFILIAVVVFFRKRKREHEV